MDISIGDNHKPHLQRTQHVLEWLQSEQQRLQSELTHVAQQGQRTQAQLMAFLQRAYGIDVSQPFTLDADAGTITVPEPDVAPPIAPEPSAD